MFSYKYVHPPNSGRLSLFDASKTLLGLHSFWIKCLYRGVCPKPGYQFNHPVVNHTVIFIFPGIYPIFRHTLKSHIAGYICIYRHIQIIFEWLFHMYIIIYISYRSPYITCLGYKTRITQPPLGCLVPRLLRCFTFCAARAFSRFSSATRFCSA